ncbi:MAG: hypothetical protein WC955_13355, partial [Elusimicrobiota bacterium]
MDELAAAEAVYNQAKAEADLIAQQNQGPKVNDERTNPEGFIEVFDGSNWTLKDGQKRLILGKNYISQNGIWAELQEVGGGVVTHTYTITTGAPSMSVTQGTTGGMTFGVIDEAGQGVSVTDSDFTVSSSNNSVASVVIYNGQVAIQGNSGGNATVTINYKGVSTTFGVTVTPVETPVETPPVIATGYNLSVLPGSLNNLDVYLVAANGGVQQHYFAYVNGLGNLAVTMDGQIYNDQGQNITGEFSPADAQSLVSAFNDPTKLKNPASTPESTPPIASAVTIAFTKTDGTSASSLKAGESWKITITGAKANARVTAQTTQITADGQTITGERAFDEITDGNGSLTITDTALADHVGTWSMQIKVDGQDVGSVITFTVLAPEVTEIGAQATLVFQKSGNVNATGLGIGESWAVSITGAKEGAQVTAQTRQTTLDGKVVTGSRVIGNIDSQGKLLFRDTVTEAHLGTWQVDFMVDGVKIGATQEFRVVYGLPINQQTNTFNAGWAMDAGGRFYNTELGLYSNADGSVQMKTTNTDLFDEAVIKHALGITSNTAVFMRNVYVYDGWFLNPDGTSGRILPNPVNPDFHATLEVANRLATLLGGTVKAVYWGTGGGPMVQVIGDKKPTSEADLAPTYMIKIGNYEVNAGLVAKQLLFNAYNSSSTSVDSVIKSVLADAAAYNSSGVTSQSGFVEVDNPTANSTASDGQVATVTGAVVGAPTSTVTTPVASTVTPDAIKNIISQFKGTPPVVTDSSFIQNLKMVDIYGHSEPVNSSHYATLEAAEAMATYLGGTVGQIDNSSPFSKVVDASGKTIVQYTIVIGNYSGNAGLILNTYKNNSKAQADSMIATEILMANSPEIYASLYGSVNTGTVTPPASTVLDGDSGVVNTTLTIASV